MARRTATGPNGEKLVLDGDHWVPLQISAGFVGPIDEMTGPLPSLGRTPEEQTSAIRQGLRSAGGSFISNMLSIPHAAGEVLASGAAIPPALAGAGWAALRGKDMQLGERYAVARNEQRASLPASALLAMPNPSAEDVLAVPGAISGIVKNANANASRAQALWRDPAAVVPPLKDPNIRATFAESLLREKSKAEEHPMASMAGRVVGDVASMLALRPGARTMNALGLNPRAIIPEGENVSKFLARGATRAAEAGIDGATIAALGDGDPAKTAAYSAGIQAVGSAALGSKGWVFKNLGSNAVRLWMGHEIYKTVMPGPQSALESKDQVFREIVGSYIAGTAAAMLGSGRGFGQGYTRVLSDLTSSASRNAIASIVTQLQESEASGNAAPARVLEMMSVNPDVFGSDVRQRLEKAAASEEPRALLNEVDSLMSSERFRQTLESVPQDEQPNEPMSHSFGSYLLRGRRE